MILERMASEPAAIAQVRRIWSGRDGAASCGSIGEAGDRYSGNRSERDRACRYPSRHRPCAGGSRAFLNDQRLRVAGRRKLDECVIACGLPHIGRGDHELSNREMAAIQNKVAGLRRFGAASLDLAFVAAGRLDGYWERNLQPWDIAAGQIMVREAGGTISGTEGSDDPLKTGHVICGNEFVHGELVKILKPLEK